MHEERREGSLSHHRQESQQAEEELHHISEKLSHRLEELDQVHDPNDLLRSRFDSPV